MNRAIIVAFSLMVMGCCLALAGDDNQRPFRGKVTDANGVEVESPNGSLPGKFRRIFGSADLLETNNGKYNTGRNSACPDAHNTETCNQCCANLDMSAKFKKFKFHWRHPTKMGDCVCFTRATL